MYSNILFCEDCVAELLRIKDFRDKCISFLKMAGKKFIRDDFLIEKRKSFEYQDYKDNDFDWPDLINHDSDKDSLVDNFEDTDSTTNYLINIKRDPAKLKQSSTTQKVKHCTVCDQAYTGTQIKHLLADHGTLKSNNIGFKGMNPEFAIECNVCSKILSDKKTFRAHFVLHTQKNCSRLSCNYCQEEFDDIGKHKYHMQKHEMIWFECDICPRKFDRKRRLKYHILSRHLGAKRCKLCQKPFTSDKLLQHEAAGCTLDPKSAVCDLCGSLFRNMTELRIHLKHVQ